MRKYRVRMAGTIFGEKGDEATADQLHGYNAAALVNGGFLEEVTPTVACPACEDDPKIKKGDVPKFQKADTLADHYEKEHRGLATPDFEEIV